MWSKNRETNGNQIKEQDVSLTLDSPQVWFTIYNCIFCKNDCLIGILISILILMWLACQWKRCDEMTKWRNFEILCNMCSCLCTVLAVSVLYFKKKHWNRLRENSKIRHFVISSHLFYWHANHIIYKSTS